MYSVLIVDDEPMAREAVRLAADWEEYGFQIVGECENGEEALLMVERARPDLILTDIRMPDMDGLELAKKVLAQYKDTIFIILSGYDEFEYAKRALKLGIQYYILKPIITEDFSSLLMEALNELERQDEMKKIAAESREAVLGIYFEKLLSANQTTENENDLPLELRPDGDTDWTYAALYAYHKPGNTDRLPVMGYDDLKKIVEVMNTRIFTVFHDTSLYGLIQCDRRDVVSEKPWNHIICTLNDLYGQNFYLSVGNPVRRLADLPVSMNQAETALEHRFFYPSGSVLLFEKIRDRSLNYSFEGIHYMEDFLDALENLDRERIASSIAAMFDAFRRSYMAPEIVTMYIVNIVHKSFAIISEMGGISEKISVSDDLRALSDVPSLDGMERTLREYTESFCQYAKSLRNSDSLSLRNKVAEYIKDNYTRSLTVKEIARHLYIHPSYLGQQINTWFGCGYNEYLHTMRMREAGKRIAETDVKIYKIAADLGYRSYNSFLEQFISFFSMKPTEFRKCIKNIH